MTEHLISWTIGRHGAIEPAVACRAPADGGCRWYCPACEEWSDTETRPGGTVWHWSTGAGERLEFPHKMVGTSCTWNDWITNDGYEDTYGGSTHALVDGPIICTFDGMFQWRYADDKEK